ncbi:TetR/AcrR family transcriptional regulator [Nocardiopsis halotolerans]|uniref:TetR/AcrR family transcriptional regulator n=1 Tax=Nocardiopsis halotolerans TaxID=124252 RepID=UPI0003481983|nr:TetR/AcrR family transcriptional regulator [Nocardiopsis halotolerans]
MVIASTRVGSRASHALDSQEHTVVPTTDPSTEPAVTERELRADRVLDAAEELMVAWGPRKVTIDDVARRAKVGKGTVYLHFATKEALLLSVVMRAQLDMIGRVVDAMRASPENVRPSEVARNLYLRHFDSPVVQAILTSGSEALDNLSRSAAALIGDVVEERKNALRTYWGILGEHGLLRDDLSFDDQLYAYNAIVIGHMAGAPLLERQGLHVPDRGTRADLIAGSVRRLLERNAPPENLGEAQSQVVELFSFLEERLREEIARQKQTKRST